MMTSLRTRLGLEHTTMLLLKSDERIDCCLGNSVFVCITIQLHADARILYSECGC